MPTLRTQEMVADYIGGMSLRKVGAKYGCSMQRVHEVVRRIAPQAMRAPGDRYGHARDEQSGRFSSVDDFRTARLLVAGASVDDLAAKIKR